jgi:hypothetical protein
MLPSQTRRVLAGLYPVALLLILSPLVDLLSAVWPIRPSEVSWRFGTFGLITSALVTPIVGLVLLQGAAALLDHVKTLRVVSALNLVVAVLVVVGAALFLLDAVQLRGTVMKTAQQSYDLAAAKALVTALLEVCALGWTGMGGIRAAGAEGKRLANRDPASSLVIGRGSEL